VPISIEDATQFLPKYLTPASREELFKELKNLPEIARFFTHFADHDPYQGDGWQNLDYVDVVGLKACRAFMLVVSNTCDMSPENKRKWAASITIAPIVRLTRFADILRSERVSEEAIVGLLKDIRAQEVTQIFYLPRVAPLEDEYLALLDQPQSQPMARFTENDEKRPVFRLSQSAFWLFLLKLSIHFCRANEGIERGYA
jgi:hypothetical protein